MAIVHFRLRQKTPTNKPVFVYLVHMFANPTYKFVYPLNLKIEPRYWNFKQERMKEIPEAKDCYKINEFLNELYNSIERYRFKLTLDRKNMTLERLKKFMDNYFSADPEIDPEQITLFKFIEKFIREANGRLNQNTGKIIGEKTIGRYVIVFNILKEMAKQLILKTLIINSFST